MIKILIIYAIAGALIGPTHINAASSHGATTMPLLNAMNVYCEQAQTDAQALNQPLTGTLKDLCQ